MRSPPLLTPPEGWTVHWTDELPEEIDGATRWSDHTIWMSTRLVDPEDIAFIFAHELQHVRRGPVRGWSQELEERLCDRRAEEMCSREDSDGCRVGDLAAPAR